MFPKQYTTRHSLSTLLTAVTSCTTLCNCQKTHAIVLKSHHINAGFIGDRLISLYTKLGSHNYAHKLFDEMPNRDLVSWNSFISGFSKLGYLSLCLNAFRRLRFESYHKPNEVTFMSVISCCSVNGALFEGSYFHGFVLKYGFIGDVKVVNGLINMYGKMGFLGFSFELFNCMKLPSLVSWNCVIFVCAQNGSFNEVLGFFNAMRRVGIRPDQGTMIGVIHGCVELGFAKQARIVHGCVIKGGFVYDIVVLTSLMSLYAKSGELSGAIDVFREVKDPDVVAWTALLASYAIHGQGSEAIKVLEGMIDCGIRPDHVTFTHLLSACSHAGLVSEGRKYFEDMSLVYGVDPRIDHYTCMVDLLGRAGRLTDACRLIREMPMEPNTGIWGALLGACRIHKNEVLGKEAAENLFLLDSTDRRNYLMLSNIYSASGNWKDASKIRSLMKERCLAGNPGYSLIEHENKVHRFVVGDKSHPNSEEIYTKLDDIIRKVHEAGVVRQTELVLHDVEEEIKLDMINKHSEKLALAFGLLVTNVNMQITIIKNLRICGDCHSLMKLVSLTEKRTIIVRDAKRFHHFSNGACSCKDYW